MSYLCCTSNIVVNEDQSATVTTELCNVCYKTIQVSFTNPEEWINSQIKNDIIYKSEYIYRDQLERYLTQGTMPPGVTKQELILSYEQVPSQP
jgi:hypothetical protein